MYSYIKGTLEEAAQDGITVECCGIGYKIYASASCIDGVPIGSAVKIYLHQTVREDDISLYGFADTQERAMFQRLLSVSGVGAKSALSMISGIGAHSIALAIVTGDVKTLTRAAGVGNKLAQRMILELRGSIDNDELISAPAAKKEGGAASEDMAQEAITAVMALGFTRAEAVNAIDAAGAAGSVEELIRRALSGMGRA